MISATHRPRLLIADDDAFVRETLYTQLETTYDVVGTAGDADDAIAKTEALRPDVVLLDVQMPGGGGLRATREIQARAPGVAIVALSADESDASVREIILAGAMAYIRKGLSVEKIDDKLRLAISAHARV
jgi:DNA-binding NarL/FixJ family response regulator